MKKMTLWGFIALMLFSAATFAATAPTLPTVAMPDGSAYTADNLMAADAKTTSDLSAHGLLNQIFGPIASDPFSFVTNSGGAAAAGDVLGTVFMFINMGLLTLGGIYLSYKSLAAVTHTAHEGEFMGKSFNSVWVPIRITTGIFALIPIAGGWSILQVAMLWFGIMGAGLGNMAWQGVVDNFKPFKSYTLSPVNGSTQDKRFMPELFKMHVCVAAHNAQNDILAKATGLSPAPRWRWSNISETGYGGLSATQFGSNNGANAECGKISFSKTGGGSLSNGGSTTLNNYKGNGASSMANPIFGAATTADVGVKSLAQKIAVAAATQKVFDKYNQLIQAEAEKFINGNVADIIGNPSSVAKILPPNEVQIRDWTYAYQAEMSDAIAKALITSNALDATRQLMKQHAEEDGFTTAGAFYMTMAQASYAMNAISQNVEPSIASSAQKPESTDSVWRVAFSLINESRNAAQVDSINADGSMSDMDSAWKMVMEKLDPSAWKPGQNMVNRVITEGSGEPVMIRLKNLADYMVTLGALVVTAVGAVIGAMNDRMANLTADLALAAATAGVGNIAKSAALGAAQVWLDMIVFVAQISMGFFLMMSIYLPMVPFIIFMGQILGWLISVVEGVAAAPFLAFAHFDTDGEGLGHKTEYGYVFMLVSFMKPVMLVLGFIFSCMLLETIGGYVMAIYPMVIANIQMDSMTGFFSILGFVAIFYVIMVGLVNSCFSVMYLLPDAIFAFIGAHNSAASQTGRNEADSVKNAVGGGVAISRQGQSRIDHNGAANRRNPGKTRQDENNQEESGFKKSGS